MYDERERERERESYVYITTDPLLCHIILPGKVNYIDSILYSFDYSLTEMVTLKK